MNPTNQTDDDARRQNPEEQKKGRTQKADNERLYLSILTRSILKFLALASLVIAFGFLILGIAKPAHFENELARFFLSLAVATSLSIFFFIFYPQRLEMTLPAWLGGPLRVVGPLVLWFVLLFFLINKMPSPETGKLFILVREGATKSYYYSPETALRDVEGKPMQFHLVPEGDRLLGIYIDFPKNIRSYNAVIIHDGAEPMTGTFSLDGSQIVPLSKLTKTEK
jgi:hypothetical protein